MNCSTDLPKVNCLVLTSQWELEEIKLSFGSESLLTFLSNTVYCRLTSDTLMKWYFLVLPGKKTQTFPGFLVKSLTHTKKWQLSWTISLFHTANSSIFQKIAYCTLACITQGNISYHIVLNRVSIAGNTHVEDIVVIFMKKLRSSVKSATEL